MKTKKQLRKVINSHYLLICNYTILHMHSVKQKLRIAIFYKKVNPNIFPSPVQRNK